MSAMKKWIVGSLTAMVVTAGSLATLAGPAQAYNVANCAAGLGANNIGTMYMPRIDTGGSGQVDFGDHEHWLGQPLSPAVICFGEGSRAGDVFVQGRVFADSYTSVKASARLTYFNSNGEFRASSTTEITGSGAANKRVVDLVTGQDIRSVNLKLFRGTTEVFNRTYTRV